MITIQNTIKDLLIGTLITAGVYLTLGIIIEYVREYNDKKDKKKTVDKETTVDEETAVSDYEDGYYEGDMD